MLQAMELELGVEDIAQAIKGMSLEELFGEVRTSAHPHRLGYYQFLHTGGIFFPLDPRPEEVFIADIARGLSSQSRFNGQTLRRMTIAEHCVHAAEHGPAETRLERLLHDAPEGYIGDQIRPLKKLPLYGGIYLKIEAGIDQAVAKRYGLQYPFPKDVWIADEAVAHAEMAQNIRTTQTSDLLIDTSIAAVENRLPCWRAEYAEAMFLDRFRMYAEERGLDFAKC